VGVIQGLILFCALGGELLSATACASAGALRTRLPWRRRAREQLAARRCDRVRHRVRDASLFGALGELLAERAGVLNLGVEGMMLIGAVMGLLGGASAFTSLPGSRLPPRSASRRSPGAAIALIHAFLVITMRASQIVSGLAITIFAGAAGLSSYLANDLNLANNPRGTSSSRSFRRACGTYPSSARSCSGTTCSSTRRGCASSRSGSTSRGRGRA
jgi:hypothetical protein